MVYFTFYHNLNLIKSVIHLFCISFAPITLIYNIWKSCKTISTHIINSSCSHIYYEPCSRNNRTLLSEVSRLRSILYRNYFYYWLKVRRLCVAGSVLLNNSALTICQMLISFENCFFEICSAGFLKFFPVVFYKIRVLGFNTLIYYQHVWNLSEYRIIYWIESINITWRKFSSIVFIFFYKQNLKAL